MPTIKSELRELELLYARIPLDLFYRQDIPKGLSRGTIIIIYGILDDHCAKTGDRQGQAWPGYKRLTEKGGTGRAQVSATLKYLQEIGKLKAAGEMIDAKDRKGRPIKRMKVNRWILTARVVPQENLGSRGEELDGSRGEELEQEPCITRTKEQEVKQSAKADPTIKNLIDAFHDKYLEARGVKYRVNGSRDGAVFKRLLRQGFEAADLLSYMDEFMLDDDRLLEQNGHTVPMFGTRVQAYAEKQGEGGSNDSGKKGKYAAAYG